MPDEVYWPDLRPMLQDMADRIARIEQFLAASGLQAPGQSSPDSFGSVPASFGPEDAFGTPGPSVGAPGFSPFPGQGPGMVPDNIVALARSGKMILAIKQYRQLSGMSLKQAKAAVEQAVRGY